MKQFSTFSTAAMDRTSPRLPAAGPRFWRDRFLFLAFLLTILAAGPQPAGAQSQLGNFGLRLPPACQAC